MNLHKSSPTDSNNSQTKGQLTFTITNFISTYIFPSRSHTNQHLSKTTAIFRRNHVQQLLQLRQCDNKEINPYNTSRRTAIDDTKRAFNQWKRESQSVKTGESNRLICLTSLTKKVKFPCPRLHHRRGNQTRLISAGPS